MKYFSICLVIGRIGTEGPIWQSPKAKYQISELARFALRIVLCRVGGQLLLGSLGTLWIMGLLRRSIDFSSLLGYSVAILAVL